MWRMCECFLCDARLRSRIRPLYETRSPSSSRSPSRPSRFSHLYPSSFCCSSISCSFSPTSCLSFPWVLVDSGNFAWKRWTNGPDQPPLTLFSLDTNPGRRGSVRDWVVGRDLIWLSVCLSAFCCFHWPDHSFASFLCSGVVSSHSFPRAQRKSVGDVASLLALSSGDQVEQLPGSHGVCAGALLLVGLVLVEHVPRALISFAYVANNPKVG